MAFLPRSFNTILTDMIAYMQARTTINDFNPGSVIRTILEAAAMEDDEQYFQMVQLLDLFSITTATGENLDRRLSDFNLVRLPAKASFGRVRFFTSNLVSDQVALDATSGGNTIKIFDSQGFSSTSFPYTIRIGEGTTRLQDVSVIALNTLSNTFTLSGSTLLTTDVFVGDRVSLVTGAQAHTINAGTAIQAPPTGTQSAKTYTTSEPAFISAGNYYSNAVLAKATTAGVSGNTGVARVSQFTGSAPFQGGGVTNSTVMEGGRNRESDEDFRARALEQLQALSRGTPLALKAASVGVEDPITGQRVVSANLLEDFSNDEVIVYIDDGTGLEADIAAFAQSSLNGAHSIGGGSVTLNDGSDFPSFGTILIGDSELISYTGKSSTDVLALDGLLTANHTSGTIVRIVDVISEGAENGQRRFRTQHFPIVRATDRVFVKEPLAASWTELGRGTEFLMNKGTGDFIVLDDSGLSTDTEVVAFYNYYTNLIAETQKVLEGDSGNSTVYPGVKAAGIHLSVEAPVIRRITVRATISAEPGFVEADIAPLVQSAIEGYISSLKIGQDVIRAKIIDAAFNVGGVADIIVTLPASNVIVLENELPSAYDSSEESLVTVI